jgi:recombination protein RecT
MSKSDVDNHAQKYSASYRYDIKNNKQSSRWSTDFDAMAKKTVIKLLLSKWGILSVEMQRAIQDDQKVYDDNDKEMYGDNHPDVIEAQDPFAKPTDVIDVVEETDADAEKQ